MTLLSFALWALCGDCLANYDVKNPRIFLYYSPKVFKYSAKTKPMAVAKPVQYLSSLNAFGKTSKASDAATAPPAKHLM